MLDFNGDVVLVTGAGRGMGREHALLLAKRGARVVVNDLGVTMEGAQASSTPADAVVAEIEAAGGQAISNHDDVSSVEGMQAMVGAAIQAWGRLDAVVHNAGIVTYAPISDMPLGQWQQLLSVHLNGAFLLAQAAWPHMAKQKHGKIVLITSQAALAGLPNSAHYTAAKTALTGLARAITLEGRVDGISANSVDVMAYTRLMEDYFKGDGGHDDVGVKLAGEEWWKRYVRADIVSPVIAWLAHRDCKIAGQIINTTAGRVSNQYLTMTHGFSDLDLSPESVRDNERKIFDRSAGTVEFDDVSEYVSFQFDKLASETGIPPIPA